MPPILKRLAIQLFATIAVTTAFASAVHAETLYALISGNGLRRFDTATPGTVIPGPNLSGIVAGHTLRGIDFRPRTGVLYALSFNPNTDRAQIYTVNLGTGLLTPVGDGFPIATASNNVSMDFNPVADRIRVVAGDGVSERINPETGTLPFVDTTIAYAPGDPFEGDNRNLIGIAYSQNYPGATSSTLYAYDYVNDLITTIGGPSGVPSPNTGLMYTVGPTGVVVGEVLGMDISDRTGIAYLSARFQAVSGHRLYRANLATGEMTLLGAFGIADVVDISVQPTTRFRNGFE